MRVPPLRERIEDIPELATRIMQRIAARLGTPAPHLGDSALAALAAYPFPGNVRELENILERAMALCSGGAIEVADLQLRPGHAALPPERAGSRPAGAATALEAGAVGGGEGLGEQLEHIEREAIIRALEQTRYNKTAAAKLLGMTFRALRYKVKKLGIE